MGTTILNESATCIFRQLDFLIEQHFKTVFPKIIIFWDNPRPGDVPCKYFDIIFRRKVAHGHSPSAWVVSYTCVLTTLVSRRIYIIVGISAKGVVLG
jgi:hypothetical protein